MYGLYSKCFIRVKENNMITKIWLQRAGMRAIKTVAQTAAAVLATGVVIADVNWINLASAAALAGIFSLVTSLAGLPEIE